MFGDDLAYAYVLGSALIQTGDDQQGQLYIDSHFRVGDSAEAHLLMGIGASQPVRVGRREDRVRSAPCS
jgi:hypothetical protein